MTHIPKIIEPQSLYELSWTYAPGGMFAFDTVTGKLVNVNPAAEALSGYSREELLRMQITLLHPEGERERVKTELLKAKHQLSHYRGFHIQNKDGHCTPVIATSSKSLLLEGRQIVIAVYRDITELEGKEHELIAQNWALGAYALAALAMGRVNSTQHILLQSICHAITNESIYVLAWVGVAEDGQNKPIQVIASAGSSLGYLDGLHLSWSEDEEMGKGPTGVCIRTNDVQLMNDSEAMSGYSPLMERARQHGIRSSVSIPLCIKGSWRGALVVCASKPNAFEPLAIEVFQHFAEQIEYGIHAINRERLLLEEQKDLARMQTQLTEALSAMVAPIVLAMEMRDPYTVGHQSRVADIAVAIGRDMGWPENRLQGLRVAAQVHDIGKISIPAEILTKPGNLNAAEREIIKAHPETGYIILKDIPFVWPIAEIVRQHHEKLDGTGYPRGLKGDEMLPEAKVLAVADMAEAMASFRPYRPGIKLHVVLEEIEKAAGSQLDEEVVRVCVALFREKHLKVPGWIRN